MAFGSPISRIYSVAIAINKRQFGIFVCCSPIGRIFGELLSKEIPDEILFSPSFFFHSFFCKSARNVCTDTSFNSKIPVSPAMCFKSGL